MFQTISRFRKRLQSGPLCIGASVTFADPLVSEALARSVDFLWIDLEHGNMSPEVVAGHLLAGRAANVPALVRVVDSGTSSIKPVLDAGACGIIVPQVRSAEEVQRAVADCRYPPLGRRGYGPRVPSNYGRDGGDDYVQRANRELFVAVQIETAEALADIDRIVALPGLDSLVVGPADLAASLGVMGNLEHPKVVAAIETITAKTRAAGLWVGAGMGADPDYACVMARRGVQWLQVGGDYGYMIQRADAIGSAIRDALGAEPGAAGRHLPKPSDKD